MAGPLWIKTLINKTFSQRFLLSKLTNFPVIGQIVDHLLFKGDDILYLPKDTVIPINTALDIPENIAAPSRVVDHFIREAGARWIMDFCICRDSSKCRDYPIELGCIFLGEAAKDINPGFGRLASLDETLEHAEKSRKAGLVHLIGRNKLDTVWLQVGPGARLLTICNCCPCCCLWKILPDIKPNISAKISRMPGVSMRVTDKCLGCGKCLENICFANAICLENKKAVINLDACRGCGRCVDFCPNKSIEVIIEDPDFINAAIQRVSRVVDVT
jgi:Pyruvate/2-oxoacid:ferredoxin oxidoreductase delta subunit